MIIDLRPKPVEDPQNPFDRFLQKIAYDSFELPLTKLIPGHDSTDETDPPDVVIPLPFRKMTSDATLIRFIKAYRLHADKLNLKQRLMKCAS